MRAGFAHRALQILPFLGRATERSRLAAVRAVESTARRATDQVQHLSTLQFVECLQHVALGPVLPEFPHLMLLERREGCTRRFRIKNPMCRSRDRYPLVAAAVARGAIRLVAVDGAARGLTGDVTGLLNQLVDKSS